MTLLNPPISKELFQSYHDPFEIDSIPEAMVKNPAVGNLGGAAVKSIVSVDLNGEVIAKALAGLDEAMEELNTPVIVEPVPIGSFEPFNSIPHNFHDGV